MQIEIPETMPRYNFHLHSCHSPCGDPSASVADIVARSIELGCTAIAITDHLRIPGEVEEHHKLHADIQAEDWPIPVYFSAELNTPFLGDDWFYTEELRGELGHDFCVAGPHDTGLPGDWDRAEAIRLHHLRCLQGCENPLVSVLVHPWCLWPGEFIMKEWEHPGFTLLREVPESWTRELAAAACETQTAIGINGAKLLPEMPEEERMLYLDFLSILAEGGCRFSLNSDAHSIESIAPMIQTSWRVAAELGLTAEQIWAPPGLDSRPV